jgi:hypothetical protein
MPLALTDAQLAPSSPLIAQCWNDKRKIPRCAPTVGVRTRSALPDVMSDAGGRSTPAVLALLAGIVHGRQRAADDHDGERPIAQVDPSNPTPSPTTHC